MIQYLKRIIKKRQWGRDLPKDVREYESSAGTSLATSLERNLASLKGIFRDCSDIVFREFSIGLNARKVALLFIDGLVNQIQINESIVKPLMLWSRMHSEAAPRDLKDVDDILSSALAASDVKKVDKLNDVITGALGGDAVLIVDEFAQAVIISVKGWDKRAVSEPENESVIRGPREGFTENLRTNTALIRRKVKSASLRMEPLQFGERTQTKVCIAYIEGIANPDLIEELRNRLKTIHTDAILSSGYIEQYIEDEPFSVFQTIGHSEKPDVVAGRLLEGRAAVIVDGTPFVLTLPMLFLENFQTTEDYEQRSFYATFLRILRLVAFIFSLLAPSLYVVFASFQQELIPTPLLFTMAASSEGVPLPATIETGLMLVAFEILKEAGVRLPKPVGQAISIVGALVMGQAAVQAGFVGAPVVIIIAFTAVSSFVSPYVAEASSLLRWYLLILTIMLGGFGMMIGLMTTLVHLASLKSFSTPYLSPFVPMHTSDLKDTLIRWPLWQMKARPWALKPQDVQRQDMQRPDFSRDGSRDSLP